ncbi:MAG: hypothetical protein ACO3QO_04935 [Candidatus Kapaibacteriota bacterium]
MRLRLGGLALVGVLAAFGVRPVSAQMVPFTSSGVSSVTPFAQLALKNDDHNEATFGAMYLTSFGLGVQVDYAMGNGSPAHPTTESNTELGVRLGYFPVWAGPTGGFNLGVVASYEISAFNDAADARVFDDVDYSLAMSTSYTATVSDNLQLIPFFSLGWSLDHKSFSDASQAWERGAYTGHGAHIRYSVGTGAVILTVQSEPTWDPLSLAVRYVIAL